MKLVKDVFKVWEQMFDYLCLELVVEDKIVLYLYFIELRLIKNFLIEIVIVSFFLY